MSFLKLDHTHQPVFRVVRAGWVDPLDATFSQRPGLDNRWNREDFPALYCCCSVPVARMVTRDIFRFAGVEPEDLQPAYLPQLVEIGWEGAVIDVASAEGVAAAGFEASYPASLEKSTTRAKATEWRAAPIDGVVARSASLARLGFTAWSGSHEPWSELAIFADVCAHAPEVLRRRDDLGWLTPGVRQ